MKVYFSERAFAAVMAETTEKITTETGGLFLGAVQDGNFYVVETIDPGPKSIFEVAYFEYDQAYTQHLINKIANLYQEKLSLIGLWHRHPGSFDIFSNTDNGTNAKYAQMRSCGAISGLVNIDPDFRLTMYHVARPCKYSRINYEVGDHLIPEKYLKLKTSEKFEQIMQEILHPTTQKDEFHSAVSLKSFMTMIEPFYTDRLIEGGIDKPTSHLSEIKDKLIDVAVSDISFMSDVLGIEMSVVPKKSYIAMVQDTADGVVKINVIYNEKDDSFAFWYNDKVYVYESGLFENMFYMAKEKIDSKEADIEPYENNNESANAESVFGNFLRMLGF